MGGDPRRLLRRAAALLVPGGTVLVETDTDTDTTLWWRGGVQLCTDGGAGTNLPWACAGADALTRGACRAGLRRTGGLTGPRSFVEFRRG